MNSYLRVIRFAESSGRKMAAAIAVLLISVLCNILPYFIFSKIFIDVISRNVDMQEVLKSALMIGAFLIARQILYTLGLDMTHSLAYETLKNIRKSVAEKMMRISLGTIESQGRGGIKKLFVEDIESLELILAHGFPEGISNMIAAAAVLITVFVIHPVLGLCIVLNIIAGGIFMGIMMKKGMEKMGPYYEAVKYMGDTLVDYVNGMEVVKVFNQTGRTFERYEKAVTDYRDYTYDWNDSCIKPMAVCSVMLSTPLLFVVPAGGILYINGILSLSGLITASLLSMSIGVPLMRVATFLPNVPILGEKSRNIFEFLGKEEIEESQLKDKPERFDVEFDNVSFRYNPEEEEYTVKDISFKTEENEVTALVGESGSGKSTLVKLLLRFWDIEKGNIRIGGTDIREISFQDLMSMIYYVSQDNFLFKMSIRENMLLGKADASDEEIWDALKAANIYETVSSLPEGLDTVAGMGGAKLSGGELQRVTIARAILKDSPIVILDEATSSTDPENEEIIQASINRMISGKTVFVIGHRMTTISDSDRIIVLKDGEINAEGNHETLMKESEMYRNLYNAGEKSRDWNIGGAENV